MTGNEPEEDWATRLRHAAVTDIYEVRKDGRPPPLGDAIACTAQDMVT
ncbi:hypothetical protein [Streptomyces sirii]